MNKNMDATAPLATGSTALLVIDMQARLFPVMNEKEKLLRNMLKLIRGAQVLEIPVVLTEQYPRGLGPTLPEIKELLPDVSPIEKVSFNCCNEDVFRKAIDALKRKQMLVAGIEAHICVYQTAVALSRSGYEVQVVSDCVASREPENKLVSLLKMGTVGVSPTTVEMALFELLGVARGDKFKQISNIVK
jgi:nicotinamidase-related amidase